MSRFFLTEAAETDLLEIWLYIAADKINAADGYLDTLRDTIRQLAEQPNIGRKRPDIAPGVMSFVCRKHLVFYTVREEGLMVFRVVHGARDIDDELLFS